MEQRIAACLHADVSGYCRLIAADVESTIRTLTTHRAVMARLITRRGGRVVDAAGDSVLGEFPSVSEAVQCALEVQRELGALNARLPEARRVQFRVGIDLGAVVAEGDRIYGDCVNIAARVQEVASPGSVCLTGSAYDRLDTRLPLRFEYVGERQVRNIDAPQRVYRVE